jgi:predicted metal-dependent enzyme (double-stranded beta helix superfamily)
MNEKSRALFAAFCERVDAIIDSTPRERTVTAAVGYELQSLLADPGFVLDPSVTVPDEDRYVMYPLYVHPGGRFSVASAVWNVGQSTPVHGHETWGVVGIYSGQENEVDYVKPDRPDVPLVVRGEHSFSRGEVTVCCTTDDDVHQVSCGGDQPCVGIHVYGADIGTLRRRSYSPESGDVSWFVSQWAEPVRV